MRQHRRERELQLRRQGRPRPDPRLAGVLVAGDGRGRVPVRPGRRSWATRSTTSGLGRAGVRLRQDARRQPPEPRRPRAPRPPGRRRGGGRPDRRAVHRRRPPGRPAAGELPDRLGRVEPPVPRQPPRVAEPPGLHQRHARHPRRRVRRVERPFPGRRPQALALGQLGRRARRPDPARPLRLQPPQTGAAGPGTRAGDVSLQRQAARTGSPSPCSRSAPRCSAAATSSSAPPAATTTRTTSTTRRTTSTGA